MTEIWKDIPEWEGLYQVSNLGRVKSLARTVCQGNRWGGISCRAHEERILVLASDRYGYRQVNLSLKNRPRLKPLVHHLVLEVFGAPRKPDQVCDHVNGDRADNRLANLRWVSWSDNGRNRTVVSNKTGFMGVSEVTKRGTKYIWASARDKSGKKIFLGMHPSPEAAHVAYLKFREEQFSHA